jgi:uncharacterized protein YPO0396
LERLLNSFSQDLIVPEEHYRRVSAYVNANNLRGRLIYHRVDPSRTGERPQQREAGIPGTMAYKKLDIKQDTPHLDWLVGQLIRRFDYVCCESMDDFNRAERAITQQGQIKHNASRHEKDDRHNLNDRRHYVLGWDNRDKLAQLETELDNLRRHVTALNERQQQLNEQLERRRRDVQSLEALLTIESFSEIDWRTRQAEVDRLKRELDDLTQESQQLQRLEKQRDQLQQHVRETSARRDAVNRKIATLENEMKGHERRLEEVERHRANWTDDHQRKWEYVGNVIEEIEQETATLERLPTLEDRLRNSLQSSIANFKGYQNRQEAVILDAMNTFKREYPDAGASLTADIQALPAYEAIHERLATDDLPKYEERFKQMLDRTVTRGVMTFYSNLTEQEREIDRSITELNDSLAQVDYGGGSIIRLLAERSPDRRNERFPART